jgi:hypothetical protein
VSVEDKHVKLLSTIDEEVLTEVVLAKDVEVVVVDPVMATIAGDHTGFREPVGLTTIAAGKAEQMTSAPKPDPGVTVYRLDHLMFLLVGTIILTSVNMGVWTLIGAVIRFFGWFGDARGSTSSASARWASLPPSSSSASWASSWCSEATSTTARAANALTAMLLGHRARVFPRVLDGLLVVVALA